VYKGSPVDVEKRRKREAARYHRRKAAGECVKCGRVALAGRVKCKTCLDIAVTWRREQQTGCNVRQYQELRGKQGGVCAICGCVPDKGLCADHDHSTNEVRGLLCVACNAGLGNFRDKPEVLWAAIKYLEGVGR
jgi:recombination endonuclease VII